MELTLPDSPLNDGLGVPDSIEQAGNIDMMIASAVAQTALRSILIPFVSARPDA
jgi:hypothetical protein